MIEIECLEAISVSPGQMYSFDGKEKVSETHVHFFAGDIIGLEKERAEVLIERGSVKKSIKKAPKSVTRESEV